MSYRNIDMVRTGMLLKHKINMSGYSVSEIQRKLNLSCPQPIYRWFKGQILPSLDNLYVLSGLLKVHVDELIIPNGIFTECDKVSLYKRYKEYKKNLMRINKVHV